MTKSELYAEGSAILARTWDEIVVGDHEIDSELLARASTVMSGGDLGPRYALITQPLLKMLLPDEDARTLEVRPGAPLISIVRTAWSVDGRPFEHSHDLFLADRVRIVARVRGRDASSLGSAVEVVGSLS